MEEEAEKKLSKSRQEIEEIHRAEAKKLQAKTQAKLEKEKAKKRDC